jgi:hypothetical protein
MGSERELEAVLISGVFGAGKSSVAAEIADILEGRDRPFAYLDLDFLAWGYPGSEDEGAEYRMMLQNLVPVAGNFLAAGARRFILAGSIHDRSELDGVKAALTMPVRVVRLTAPWLEIERRLRADPTTGRQDDLRRAAAAVAASEGVGIEDLTVSNDRPLRQVAMEIVEWLGWT